MGMPSDLFALIRGATSGSKVQINASPAGDLYSAQGQAPYTEAARAGGIWNVISASAAPVVVVPSTTCILEVYNQLNSGMVMEILDVFIFELLTTAVEHGVAIWAQVSPQRGAVAIPTLSALSIGSQSGRAPYTTTANTRVITAAGTTVVANGWRPFGSPNTPFVSTGVLPMCAFSAPVDGKLLVPPGASLCLSATDTLATASSVQLGATWNERPIASLPAVLA